MLLCVVLLHSRQAKSRNQRLQLYKVLQFSSVDNSTMYKFMWSWSNFSQPRNIFESLRRMSFMNYWTLVKYFVVFMFLARLNTFAFIPKRSFKLNFFSSGYLRIMQNQPRNQQQSTRGPAAKRFSSSKDDGNADNLPKKLARPIGDAAINPAIQNLISRPATAPSGNNNEQSAASSDKRPRNRNRNRNQSALEGQRNDNAPAAPVSTPSAPVGKHTGARNVAVEMDVDSDSEKPAYLTNSEFRSFDISANTVRALSEVMKFKCV